HLPGKTSSEAFIYLQGIWLQKEKRQTEEEREEKKVKVLLAIHIASAQTPDKNRPTCTNPNCRKVGHTIQKCWAKGGGAEAATASTTTATVTPLEIYILSADTTRDSANPLVAMIIPF
ncbi:hypothetical protein EV359DRAFT_69263, partial [Lentinula novae-zelandiae]